MTFMELYNKLSTYYPNELRCEWDNDGIMCSGNLNKEVNKVLISLDITCKTVEYAVKNGFDTIVSHHPLVFRSQKSLTPTNFTQRKLIELIKNDINVMSFHTRLDAADGGVNDILCRLLSMENVSIDPQDRIGRIGYVSNMPLSDFAKGVKEALSAPVVLFSGNRPVQKVYVVGGDGKDLIDNAISLGCDTLVTGRASYNTSVDAEDMELNIVEAGHFFTEHPVCEELKSKILEILPEVEAEVYYSNQINFI